MNTRVYRLAPMLAAVLLMVGSVAGCARSPEEHLAAAQELRAEGDLRAAVVELKSALEGNPDLAAARYELGWAAQALGDFQGAVGELERAMDLGYPAVETAEPLYRAKLNLGQAREVLEHFAELDGGNIPTLQALAGRAHLAVGEIDAGRALLEAALADDAGNADALVGLAYLAANDGDMVEAERLFAAAREADPANAEAWLGMARLDMADNDYAGAIENFSSARQATQQPMVKLQAALGIMGAQMRQGDPDATLATFDGMRGAFKDTPQAKYLQALALYSKGELGAADDALLGVQKFLPNHVPTLLLQGLIAANENRLEAAQTNFEKVLSRTGALEVRKLLANVYLRQGKPADAVETLDVPDAISAEDPQIHALLGNAKMRAGDAAGALRHLEKAGELTPANGRLQQQIALSHLALGDEAKAVESLRSAAQMPDAGIQSEALLVFVKLRAGDFAEAGQEVERIRGLYPDDPMVDVLQGLVALAQEDLEGARAGMNTALERQPGYAPALNYLATMDIQAGNLDAAKGRYQRLLEEEDAPAQSLLALVGLERQTGNQEAALKLLQSGIDRYPDVAAVRLELARQYLAANDAESAVTAGEAALDRGDTPLIRLVLAQAYLGNGRADDAVDVLADVAADNPDNPQIRLVYARAQMAAGMMGAARDNLTRALELSETPSREMLRSLVSVEAESRNWRAALAAAQRWRDLEPESVDPVIAYADVQLDSGDSRSAQRTLRSWIAEHPDDQAAELALATITLESGDSRAAIRSYEALLEDNPDNVVALNNLAYLYQETGDSRARVTAERAWNRLQAPAIADTYGWILLAEGDVDRALDLLSQAARGMQDNPSVRYHYAVALARKGRNDAAKNELQAALASEAEFAEQDAARELLRTL